MKYIQVGELGKAIWISSKELLPAPSSIYQNKFYIVPLYSYGDESEVYTCIENEDSWEWKPVRSLPALTNGITSGSQLFKDVEAIDSNGVKVTGTFTTGEKAIEANGTYFPNDDNVGAYNKVVVNIQSGTSENPYIATTETELLSYLAKKYVNSYVKYENSQYRPSLPININAEQFNLFDIYLGQNSINAYIDSWLGIEEEKKILSYEHSGLYTLSDSGYTFKVTRHYVVDIYGYKILKENGTYCRALVAAIAFGQCIGLDKYDASQASYTGNAGAMAIYVDNCTESELQTLFPEKTYEIVIDNNTLHASRDMSLEAQINTGWIYQEGVLMPGDSDVSSMGAAALSMWLYYFKSELHQLTAYVQDAPVLIGRAVTGGTRESYREWRNGYVYLIQGVNKKSSLYQAESPLEVGDQAAGATWYLNPNFTAEDLKRAQEIIPQSEYAGSEAGFLFLNVDNPYKFSDESASAYTPLWCPMIMGEGSGPTLQGILIMYALIGEDSDVDKVFLLGQDSEGNLIDNFKQASITIPATWGSALLEETMITPATITKINYPEILNQFVGKTANFTATEQTVTTYHLNVAKALGNLVELGDERDLTVLSTQENKPWKMANTVVRYTGSTTNNYNQGALCLIMEE